MKRTSGGLVAALILAALIGPSVGRAEDTPALVAAYARQLATQCGPLPPNATTPDVVTRVDLNGDKLDDWIVDAGRYPCPSRASVAASLGAQITIFKGIEGGLAVPAFQRVALTMHLHRPPGGLPYLSLTLAGADCGAASENSGCERIVVWGVKEGRFELVAPAKASAKRE